MNDEMFVLVEASKLSMDDEFMKYKRRTDREEKFAQALYTVIKGGIKDFYRPKVDPSFNEEGEICFGFGLKPAVGKSYNWWYAHAMRVDPKRKSRLGTKTQYIAFLGVLIKRLVEDGWSVENAWDAVCNNSKKLGHYKDSDGAKGFAEITGSREFCGFFDLANTSKILAEEEKDEGFWVAGDSYNHESCYRPLAYLDLYNSSFFYGYPGRRMCWRFNKMCFSTGWIVFEDDSGVGK